MIEFIVRNWNVLLAIILSATFVWHYAMRRKNLEFATIFVLTMFIALLMLKR